ncbi:MAG TPA: hypothetical protein VH413_06080 [Verrucomicrobiae bacterium]|jgi:hypothetical protein|nr:hypothetical protein [Verrucomicrobiae bacterium]
MTAPVPANAVPENAADGWFTPGRFAALLAIFLALAFPGILLGQETFFYRDFGLFGYPLAHYQRDCFWRGELPLWNPLNDCGLPFLAQWNTLVLYPPALFYLIFPLSWSLGVFNLGHLFLAGMGMYFLAHRWTGNRLAASIAGLAFAFNGLTWHALMWPNDIAGLAWMPWVVWAAKRAWREGGRRIAIGAVIGALQMLTGAPEIILLTWLFIGALWLPQFILEKKVRVKFLLRAVAMGLLVGGIAAAQLLPFLDLLHHSHRDTGFSSGADWAMPLSGPANFLVPLFHTYAGSQGVFVQYDQYWISSHYLGVGIIALALAGVWGVRRRGVWFLFAAAVASVLMALGANGYLYPAVKAVLPQLGFIRYPIKFVVVAMLVIPLLAAYGVAWFQNGPETIARKRITFVNVMLILLALMALIVWVEYEHPLVRDDWTAVWHNAIVRAVFLILAVQIFLALNRSEAFQTRLLARVGLLLALGLDVYTHAPNLSPTVTRSVYQTGIIQTELGLPQTPYNGGPRFMETLAAMDKVHYTALAKPSDDYLCRRVALFDNCNLIDGVPKIDGFYSLYLRETEQVIAALYGLDGPKTDLKPLKDFLEIGYSNPVGNARENPLDWVARTNFMPLVTAGQKPIFVDETNSLIALVQTNFTPREIVYLPLAAKNIVTAKQTTAHILNQNIQSQRLDFKVTADAPAMVVIAQSFYHPWRAYVDGARVTLWEANHAFQALEIPAGAHEVKLIYRDRALELGALISLVSFALASCVWIRDRA